MIVTNANRSSKSTRPAGDLRATFSVGITAITKATIAPYESTASTTNCARICLISATTSYNNPV